jgi:hypothetical protein
MPWWGWLLISIAGAWALLFTVLFIYFWVQLVKGMTW